MAIRPDSWTFPIKGSATLVVALPDWEGLLLLNTTAAWLWKHRDDQDLTASYAETFDIPTSQALQDIDAAFSGWERKTHAPKLNLLPPPELTDRPVHSFRNYLLGNTVFLLRFLTEDAADEVMPRLRALEVDAQPSKYILDLIDDSEAAFLFRDGHCFATERYITGARVILLQELTRLAVPGRDFSAILHAGAIGNSESCLLIAGASFSGKSTLCAAMMSCGLLCYSDDSACLTKDYQIAGMPFAISLREGSWPLFPELDKPRFIDSNLGSTSPTCTPNALVFVQYDPNAENATLETVETFDALVALHTSGFWVEHSEAGIGRFIDWLTGLPIYHLHYSGLDSAIAEVKKLLK